jgi:predicted ATPase
MPSRTRCSDTPTSHRIKDDHAIGSGGRRALVLTLEGMPGAGKTTLANTLRRHGYMVVPEYAAVDGSVIVVDDHPAVDQDDSHQRNWLRKHQLATTASISRSTADDVTARGGADAVWLDRDWITALAYAHSLDDQALLAARAGWATQHIATGRLAVASAYLVLQLDPDKSLRRRAGRLDPRHPWSTPGALGRLADFYRDPAEAISRHRPDLATAVAAATWVQVEAPTPRHAIAAAIHLLRSQRCADPVGPR